MQTMPEGYRDALNDADSAIDVYISVGVGIDTTAADDITDLVGSYLPMSNKQQAVDAVYKMTTGLCTFEGPGIQTTTAAGNIAPPLTSTHYPPEVGLWSAAISDAEGDITFSVQINLSASHTSALRFYIEGPAVLAATATFSDGTTDTMECAAGYIQTQTIHTYNSVTVNISKLDAPYMHVRIVEIEFGASFALSKSALRGEVVGIMEHDPLMLGMPLHELDFDILNVMGEYDADNPATRLDTFRIGIPVELSYTVTGPEGDRYTCKCGRYYIGERSASATAVSLTAFDPRWLLADVYKSWTIPGDQNIGKTLDDLLADYSVPHIIDTALYSVNPDGAYTFGDDTSILDDLLDVAQCYGIYFVPGRDGSVRVTAVKPTGTYGNLPTNRIYAWPTPNQPTLYNVVSVGYEMPDEAGNVMTYYVEQDLRTDPTQARQVLQVTGNHLITSQTRATTVKNRLVSAIMTEEVETDWTGDPAMDPGDAVGMPGLWTQAQPRTYNVTYIESTYDGTFSQTVRGSL